MIYFVIPAYNEEANVGVLLRETHAFMTAHGLSYRAIVVDDGSSDATGDVVRQCAHELPCELVSYRPNRGVGEAFRQGLHQTLRSAKQGDWIVTKEADRTSDLNILPQLLDKVRGGSDLALASCYAPGGGVEGAGPFRLVISRCANILIGSLFHLKGVHTYSSFYRVYRPEALRRLLAHYGDFYEEKGFACMIELLVRSAKLGLRIEEVPMKLVSGRRVGKSKMKVARTTLDYFRVIRRNLFHR